MRIAQYHVSNLGRFAGDARQYADAEGYVRIHDSSRYEAASMDQLYSWLDSRNRLVQAAAATELAGRRIIKWQRTGEGA